METVRLTESLSINPESADARVALSEHLAELRESAAELGLVHLETSLGAALDQLFQESFSPVSVLAVRVLAWRYEELAGVPARSGTHPVVPEAGARAETLRSIVDDVTAEIRRGLLDSAKDGLDTSLGEGRGTELLTPVWKAIADLRALVEERSGGAVRFEDVAGVPLLTLSGVTAPETLNDGVSLQGRRVLVADDDAEVRWFYVGVLREAGARVVEAADGLQALELAREEAPDLILADIVMPRLDGLGLCAKVRREPGLDGVPVVLLSWRDDYLHRMRELRAGAHDYLRKELPARQILDRVAAVLRPLTLFEESLSSEAETRGDLEDLGVPVLFRAVRRLRPDTRVVLQDPWSLFEVSFSQGRIVDVARTAIDGTVTLGAPALTSLVGMSSGRFVVAQPMALAEHDEDSLEEELETATRRLSALVTALQDAPDCRVELDPAVLTTYVRHSPKGVQKMIARLVEGEPPRRLWESGEGSRAVVDALLITLARQGAVREVVPEVEASPEATPTVSPVTANDEQVTETEIDRGPSELGDPLERENFRAQWAVSMHREPVNPVSRFGDTIWRRQVDPGGKDDEFLSGFALQLQLAPRVLGWSFAMVFCATVGFLLWREGVRGSERVYAGDPQASEKTEPGAQAAARGDEEAVFDGQRAGLTVHAGRLRSDVDPSLVVVEGQGVLELVGSEVVAVDIDGEDHGALPLTLVLEEGRHLVRYRTNGTWTYRFYYVKAGATRVLRVSPASGGFVDAL